MTYLRVAKSGYNAITDTNPQHFYFNSDYDTFKFIEILSPFSVTVSDDGGGTGAPYKLATASISMPSYSYTPFVSCYIQVNSTSSFGGYNGITWDAGSSFTFFYLDTSSNTGIGNYWYPSGGTTTTTFTFYVYIFGNSI